MILIGILRKFVLCFAANDMHEKGECVIERQHFGEDDRILPVSIGFEGVPAVKSL